MRSNVVMIGLFFAAAAHAQQVATAARGVVVQAGVPVPLGQPNPAETPAAVPAKSPAVAEAPRAAPGSAPGVVTLSEVAKQASSEPVKALAVQPAPEVPAIAPVDGSGDTARIKMRALEPVKSILLSRISSVDGGASAVVWVKGQHRKVAPGSRVLQYTIGEIRDDGVCLYKSGAHARDKCPTLLTFSEGVL